MENKPSKIKGLDVISFEQFLSQPKNSTIVISTKLYHAEIYKQLINNGFSEDSIINVGKMIIDMSEEQYFDLPNLKHMENESFVDGGCFDGKSSLNFIKWSNDKYKNIWAFEPDEISYERSKKCLNQAQIFKLGLWSHKGNLYFDSKGKANSRISEEIESDNQIKVTDMDSVLGKEQVTFIKFDLEGAEIEAIKGAKQIITNQKPKLAICIYHKYDDVWEIPALLLHYNPEYRFYVRHYSLAASETVLYAV